ncbi:helix-turn-helix domain-containing protein [Streptomyces griseofuscus]|uniref:helix-turn-helix domain-containing protein n=1 Tax=Streptomyces griseofuscus TaxID=146922 RepID=UPI003F514CFE
MILGRRLERPRIRAGLGYAEAGAAIGAGRSTIRRMEAAEMARPRLADAEKTLQVHGMTGPHQIEIDTFLRSVEHVELQGEVEDLPPLGTGVPLFAGWNEPPASTCPHAGPGAEDREPGVDGDGPAGIGRMRGDVTTTRMVPMSDLCQDLYGLSAAPPEAFLNHGKALLVIAGADGEVGEAELARLVDHQRRMGAPEEVIGLYEEFDHRGAELMDLLPAIRTDVDTWQAATWCTTRSRCAARTASTRRPNAPRSRGRSV